jgi:hypothetical protein
VLPDGPLPVLNPQNPPELSRRETVDFPPAGVLGQPRLAPETGSANTTASTTPVRNSFQQLSAYKAGARCGAQVWSNIIALVLLLVAPASAGSGNFTEAERRELCAHAANDGRWRCNGTLGADMPPPVEGWQWSEDAVELCGTHHHTLE